MSGEATPFLAAIAEHDSDDVAVYQVYADWLEDRGDPQAEFIRLQCSKNRSVAEDLRMRWLLAEHETEWLAPLRQELGDLDQHVGRYYFANGVPAGALVSAKSWVQHGREIVAHWPALRTLALDDSHSDFFEVTQGPSLRPIRELRVPDARSDDELIALIQSPHLQRLRSLRIDPRGSWRHLARVLASRPWAGYLQRIEFPESHRPAPARSLGSTAFFGLRHLDVRKQYDGQELLLQEFVECAIDFSPQPPAEPKTLSLAIAAQWLPQLETLRIDSLSAAALLGLRKEAGLQTLDVGGSGGLPGLEYWINSAGFPTLTRLYLDGCEVLESHVKMLVQVPWLTNLRRLSLAGNRLHDAGLELLVSSPLMETLEELNVSGCELSDVGLKALANADAPHLVSLNLENNPFVGDGMTGLVESPMGRRLKSLALGSTIPGSPWQGLSVQLVNQMSLERLTLRNVASGSGVFHSLVHAESSSLRELRLLNCHVGADGLRAFLGSSAAHHLKILDLSGDLTQAEITALAESQGLSKLRSLRVSTRSNDLDLSLLLKSPHLGNLVHLSLPLSNLNSRCRAILKSSDTLPNLMTFESADSAASSTSLIPRLGVRAGLIRSPSAETLSIDPYDPL